MLDDLTTESGNPRSVSIDSLSAFEIVRLMNAEDAGIAAAVEHELPAIARAVDLIAAAFQSGGRLVYLGAGTSGRLGVLDASECPPTFNSPPEQVIGLIAGGPEALTRAIEGAEDHAASAIDDLERIQFGKQDVLVGIATSGRTPYVLGGLQYANEFESTTVGITCNASSAMDPLCDVMIAPIVGPEVISGSTRLKAGTATKMVLNMLTTGAMVRCGKTYGNLMVDLRATNDKLAQRAQRIVAQLTGLPADAARQLLEACSGELKTAIVAECLGIRADEARSRLTVAEGHLRRALEDPAASEATSD